jgi:hypothetical protein
VTGEGRLERTDAGLVPRGEGWFVLNAAEGAWWRHDGTAEPREAYAPFPTWTRGPMPDDALPS